MKESSMHFKSAHIGYQDQAFKIKNTQYESTHLCCMEKKVSLWGSLIYLAKPDIFISSVVKEQWYSWFNKRSKGVMLIRKSLF